MSDASILWVTPKWPMPFTDGARVATRALLRSLSKAGLKIDLLTLAGDDEACDPDALERETKLRGEILIERRPAVGRGAIRHMKNVARMVTRPNLPVTIGRYSSNRLQAAFREYVRSGDYRSIVFDGLHCAGLSLNGGLFRKPDGVNVIYRAHNVETMLWQLAAESAKNPVERKALLHQRRLVARFEQSVLLHSDLIAAVSEDDIEEFRDLDLEASYAWIPIGLDFAMPAETVSGPPFKLLYAGRLDWPPNRDGLAWFLNHVWPKVERDDLVLRIAGSGDDSWLQPYKALPRLELLGCVDDVDGLYQESIAALVPVFYGSGTRLKVIEPARFRRCCIASAAAIKGSILTPDDCILAEDETDWIGSLRELSVDDAITRGERAFTALREIYDEDRIAETFIARLDAIESNRRRRNAEDPD